MTKMLDRQIDLKYNIKMTCLDSLVPAGHLLREIENTLDFSEVYRMVEHLYCEDNGRPAVDPVVLVKVDAGYKTSWICKKVQEDGRSLSTAYKRPMSKQGFFRSYEYVYDEYYDYVICPNNQVLRYINTNRDGYREFNSNPRICTACPFLHQCSESSNHQKVVMKHIRKPHVETAEDYRHSPAGKASYSLRGQTIERVFADTKEKYGMLYTLHRGLDRVKNWGRLKFAAMNLKKLAM